MIQYVTYEISNGKSRIRCPGAKCKKGEIEFKEVKELVDEEVHLRFLIVSKDKAVFLSKQQKWCPEPNCNTVCKVQNKSLASKTTCPNCQKEFCSKCDQNWDDHHEECSFNPIEITHQDLSVQPCPECQVPIQKQEGCFHVQCSICETEFCWDCMTHFKSSSRAVFHFKCNGRINWHIMSFFVQLGTVVTVVTLITVAFIIILFLFLTHTPF